MSKFRGVVAFVLCTIVPLLSPQALRAQDFRHGPAEIVPVQYRGPDSPCRGLRGWDRDRCERGRWRDHRGPRRNGDKDIGAGIAAGLIGLAVGAIIVGAAKDAEDRREQEMRARQQGRMR